MFKRLLSRSKRGPWGVMKYITISPNCMKFVSVSGQPFRGSMILILFALIWTDFTVDKCILG